MKLNQWFTSGLVVLCLSINYLELAAVASRTSAQLKGVRIRPESEATQVILDLNSIPEDLKIYNKAGNTISATFTGGLAPGMRTELKRFNEPNLQQVYWEKTGDKVQVFLKMKLSDAASVYPLHQPERLVFNVRNHMEAAPPVKPLEASSGVSHKRLLRHTKRGPIRINVIEVDPKNPSLEILPVLASGKMQGKAKAEVIARKSNAIAGINGSFFKPDQGIPLGLLIINDELITGPLYDRVALGITQDQGLRMERVGMRGELNRGNLRVRLDNVNQPRTNASQTVLYTARWGAMAPKMPENGIQFQLQGGKVTAVSTEHSLPIPTNGYVVSGAYTAQLASLALDPATDPMEVTFYTIPDWSDVKHAISGGPYLLRNGGLYVDAAAQRFNFKGEGSTAPRSAVGITASGKLLLVTVDGRQKGVSVGVTLNELAYLMKELGAMDAMNLDGGSSTQMVVSGHLVNSPSVPSGVGVSNCLIIRSNSEAMNGRGQLNRSTIFNGSL